VKFKFIELIGSAFGKRDQKFRQRLSIFLVCLVISIFVWFTLKMDNKYQEVVPISLKFTNAPRTKVLLNVSDSMIFVEVHEKGSELLKYKYIINREALVVNMRNIILTPHGKKSTGYILTTSLIDDLGYQMGLTGRVVSISPDTLYFTFMRESSRKVPVTAEADIGTEKQYMVYGNLKFEPDSVVVKGPDDLLAGVRSVSIGKLTYKELHENVSLTRPILFDQELKYLTAIPNEVQVTIPVEKFTEASIEVPITVVADSGLRIKLFPETVTVNYLVALKDYSQVTPGMFLMVTDFRGFDILKEKKIKVRAEEAPPTLKITHIEPEKVEFIILN
jgi:hypothetical protein